MNKLPAQLSYLVIFNPTLAPLSKTEDEDDIEQAHILLYTSRSQAVSRDTMLRQVGLAKALINFSALFTHESSCDNIHSQQKRMIMFSPEPNFWIHSCVDLSRISKPPINQNGKGKAKDTSEQSAETFEYLDSESLDSLLTDSLRRAYEEFKLLNGSFEELLQRHGVPVLERRLEQYFTLWAWQWDLGATPQLPSHLGLPVYHRHKRIRPIIEDLVNDLPSTAIPFIVHHDPPCLLNVPLASSADLYPLSLPRYLFSLRPPPFPSTSQAPPSSESTTAVPANSFEAETGLPSTFKSLAMPITAPFTSASTFMPTLTNPKKWAWPGYLTINRSKPSEKEEQPTVPLAAASPPLAKALEGASQSTESEPLRSEAAVDTTTVAAEVPTVGSTVESTAPSTANGGEEGLKETTFADAEPLPANLPSITPKAQDLLHNVVRKSSSLQNSSGTVTPVKSADQEVETSVENSEGDALGPYPPLPPSPPPPPPFNELYVHLPSESGAGRTERRTVLHISSHGLTFAVLIPPGEMRHDPDRHLEERVEETLKLLRQALDGAQTSMTNLLKPVNTVPSKYVTFDSRTRASLPSTPLYEGDAHLFGADNAFER